MNFEHSKSPDILQIPNSQQSQQIQQIQAITPDHSPQHSMASEPEPMASEPEPVKTSNVMNATNGTNVINTAADPPKFVKLQSDRSEVSPTTLTTESITKPPNRRVRSYSARDTNTVIANIDSIPSPAIPNGISGDSDIIPKPNGSGIGSLHQLVMTSHHQSKSQHESTGNVSSQQSGTPSPLMQPPSGVPTTTNTVHVLSKPVMALQLISDRRGSEMSGITGISSIPDIPDNHNHNNHGISPGTNPVTNPGTNLGTTHHHDGNGLPFHFNHGSTHQFHYALPSNEHSNIHLHHPQPLRTQQSASIQSNVSSVISLPPQAITADQQWKQQIWKLQQQMMNISDFEVGDIGNALNAVTSAVPNALQPPSRGQHQYFPSASLPTPEPSIPGDGDANQERFGGRGRRITESTAVSEMTVETGSGDTNSGSSPSTDSESDSGESENTESAMTGMSSVSQNGDEHQTRRRQKSNVNRRKVIIMVPEDEPKPGHVPQRSISGLPIVSAAVEMEDSFGIIDAGITPNEREEQSESAF